MSKKKIREAKTEFYRKALSSSKLKDVWKIIHSVLNPPPNRIKIKPAELNTHFASTAFRTIGKHPIPTAETEAFINNAGIPTTYSQVLKIIKTCVMIHPLVLTKSLLKFIKIAAEYLCSPLTHIINNFILHNKYPSQWKTARIQPINKINIPTDISDYRPISILSCMSKIFEKIVLAQLITYIENSTIYTEKP